MSPIRNPRQPARAASSPLRRETGFTILELTVSLAVTVIILLAVLQLFDFSSKLSRVQSNVADMQQTQRVTHYELPKMIRMAGRGGLPAGNLPAGAAVAVADNVPANTTIGGGGTETVVAGTDVLTIRGAFNFPVYMVERSATPSAFSYNSVTQRGTVRIYDLSAGTTQALAPLVDAINNNRPEALLLVSAVNSATYVVVELDPAASVINLTPPAPTLPNVLVGFRFGGGTNTAAYRNFTSSGPGVFPPTMSAAGAELAYVSILEEYRYYLRDEREIPGDATSDLVRRLSRAQTYPGTNTPYRNLAANWTVDIADNVLDLQIALGVNTLNGGCAIVNGGGNPNCTIAETANGANDDWLYNDNQAVVPATWANADLYYVRLNTLVRTDKRDRTYEAPLIARIENRDYTALTANTAALDRQFRRRVLQTVIDLRNL